MVHDEFHAGLDSALEVDRLHVAPFPSELLEDQPSVAVFGRRLAAEQGGGRLEHPPVDLVLDLPLLHELQEATLVVLPAPLPLLVIVEQVLRRREQGLVEVLGAAYLLQEVAEVLL